MTVEERVVDWLRNNKQTDICDQCLLKKLNLGPSLQQVRNITASVGAVREMFRRTHSTCSNCGDQRLVTRWI